MRIMPQGDPIADYADRLARRLSFDVPLSRRVRAEVEDHLWQAADALGGASPDHQRQAIASFGDADELARQYLADCLLAQVQQAGVTMALAVIGVFAAMEGRVAWYAFMQWPTSPFLKLLSAVGLPIDRYAFLLAIALALAGYSYLATRRTPADLRAAYRRQLSRGLFLCGAATGALLVGIAVETVLIGVRLAAMPPSPAIMVPVLSMVAEIALVVAVILRLATAIRHAAAAARLTPR
jgi:hypothetical protein